MNVVAMTQLSTTCCTLRPRIAYTYRSITGIKTREGRAQASLGLESLVLGVRWSWVSSILDPVPHLLPEPEPWLELYGNGDGREQGKRPRIS